MIHRRFNASEDLLEPGEIDILREAFEDGDAAEHVDFLIDQYVPLEDLYTKFEEYARVPGFWEDVPNVHFLAIKLFYKLIREVPVLDVNGDLDSSVIYWANQVSPILSKILADKSHLASVR
jgi:hypothetical protein